MLPVRQIAALLCGFAKLRGKLRAVAFHAADSNARRKSRRADQIFHIPFVLSAVNFLLCIIAKIVLFVKQARLCGKCKLPIEIYKNVCYNKNNKPV